MTTLPPVTYQQDGCTITLHPRPQLANATEAVVVHQKRDGRQWSSRALLDERQCEQEQGAIIAAAVWSVKRAAQTG